MNILKKILNNLTNKFINKFIDKSPKTEDELTELLTLAHKNKILSEESHNMIKGVLEISNMQARDIMIPRSQMIVIEKDSSLDEYLPQVIESGHSRFPVIGENRDEILGILLAKDILSNINKQNNQINLKSLLRDAMVIPESKRLNSLLKEFRKNRQHMAIIADEYGGISGLVTIEDILEQIVGDIEDETDIEEENNIINIKNNTYQIQALTTIEEFNTYFKTDFSDEEFDTIGGLVLNKFGYLPQKNETTEINGFKIKVINSDKRRIRVLKITDLDKVDKADNSNNTEKTNKN